MDKSTLKGAESDKLISVHDFHLNVPGNEPIKLPVFTVNKGDCLHIKAKSGRGKSFFYHTLLGMTPESLKLAPDWCEFKSLFVYIPAYLPFFSETVLEELQRVQVDQHKINQLIKTGLIAESFLRLRCIDLSSGQNQLLIFIRGVLSDKPILIMDELMNAMDFELKTMIISYLREHVIKDRALIYSLHESVDLPDTQIIEL